MEQQSLVGVARSGQGELPRPWRAEHLFGTARLHQRSRDFQMCSERHGHRCNPFLDSVFTRYMGPPCWIPCSPGCAVDRLQSLVGLQETSTCGAIKIKTCCHPLIIRGRAKARRILSIVYYPCRWKNHCDLHARSQLTPLGFKISVISQERIKTSCHFLIQIHLSKIHI